LTHEVNNFRNDNNLLSFIDIVLNHTSFDSTWLPDHPDAAYNIDSCPHLYSAYLYDKALKDFSDKYSKGGLGELPRAPMIDNEEALNKVVSYVETKIIPSLNIP